MPPKLIHASGLTKHYRIADRDIPVLKGINLGVDAGEFVAVMGPSGSGKSTLLHILGCLHKPSAGAYRFADVDVLASTDRQLSHIRSRQIGFVFQTFNLIPALTVYENVELPFIYSAVGARRIKPKVHRAIVQVGLEERGDHRPAELSGGEMQRAAIARALAVDPKLILADEPTGNLDSSSSRGILKLFRDLHHTGVTIVMITHDSEVAAWAQRTVMLKDGRLVTGASAGV